MKKLVIGFCLFLFLVGNLAFAQETITLSTYYPAPFGVYRTLEVQTSNDPGNRNNIANIVLTNLNGNPSIQFADADPTGNVLTNAARSELVVRGGVVSFVNRNNDFDDDGAAGSFPPAAIATNPSIVRVRELWICTGNAGL
tara:strand:- start:1147 stop:1569 length:423 start_codon:yes stop_codon:yes gene_type:complete